MIQPSMYLLPMLGAGAGFVIDGATAIPMGVACGMCLILIKLAYTARGHVDQIIAAKEKLATANLEIVRLHGVVETLHKSIERLERVVLRLPCLDRSTGTCDFLHEPLDSGMEAGHGISNRDNHD